MKIEHIIFGIIYFSAVIAEAWYSKKKNLKLYERKDSLLNLSIGILAVTLRILFDIIVMKTWIYLSNFRLFEIGDSFLIWILLFLLSEFTYYWYHRYSHQNRILWAIHVNHHSSQHLNLLTAARLPIFSMVIQGICWTPLALVGFDPVMIFVIMKIGFVFVAFQHLRVLGKHRKLEYVFNTPELHEIHHANNPEYINHNFGLLLSIFDHIFGTFKAKNDAIPVTYGITENIQTHNIFLVIFHEWIAIFKDFKAKYFS